MGHIREALLKAKAIVDAPKSDRAFLDILQSVKTPAEAEIFLREALAIGRETAEEEGVPPLESAEAREGLLRFMAQELMEINPLEERERLEKLFNIKATPRPRSLLDLLRDTGGVVILGGGGSFSVGGLGPCPGCPNCQPERFDPNTITVEGHTVSEESPKSGELRRLLGK